MRTVPLLLLLSLLPRSAAAQAPAVQRAAPRALRPGATSEVQLSGQHLADVDAVRIDHGRAKILDKGASQLKLELTLEADAPPTVSLVVASAKGGSGAIQLAVDRLPQVVEQSGANRAIDSAQSLPLPVGVTGVTDQGLADFYRIAPPAGTRLSVAVIAARLGEPCDPVLRVLDEQGRELAAADDRDGWGGDCQIVIDKTPAPPLFVSLRDSRHRGSGGYYLRLGDFPASRCPQPLAVAAGSTTLLTFAGAAPQSITAPAQPEVAVRRCEARRQPGLPSQVLAALVRPTPQLLEHEPNNEPAQAQPAVAPCGINGRLSEAGDVDWFSLAVRKGEVLHLSPTTRSLGSPLIARLRLTTADGSKLAESSVDAEDEPQLTWTSDRDGVVLLRVTSLLRDGGAEHAYHVEASVNSFQVRLKHDPQQPRVAWNVHRDSGAAALDLEVLRHGYDGPLRLVSDPPGLQLLPDRVPTGAEAVHLAVRPAAPERLQRFRIRAIPERGRGQHVDATAAIRDGNPQLAYPPPWLAGWLTFATIDGAPGLFKVSASDQAVYLLSQRRAIVHLRVERIEKKLEQKAIRVVVEGLPAGTKSAVSPHGEAFTVTITGPGELPEGVEPRLHVIAEHGGKTQQVTLPVKLVPLEAAPPIEEVLGAAELQRVFVPTLTQ